MVQDYVVRAIDHGAVDFGILNHDGFGRSWAAWWVVGEDVIVERYAEAGGGVQELVSLSWGDVACCHGEQEWESHIGLNLRWAEYGLDTALDRGVAVAITFGFV